MVNVYQIFETSKHSLFKGYNKKKLDIEAELKRAIDNNEFILHYQPTISLSTGKIVELEALIRWNHPQLGLITPNKFIHIAENTSMGFHGPPRNALAARYGLWYNGRNRKGG
ncbi:MAG: EAL domain-containing protein [Nitrospira sp.]|nr:EAL domain-containing protein [Nitrospira sp.]